MPGTSKTKLLDVLALCAVAELKADRRPRPPFPLITVVMPALHDSRPELWVVCRQLEGLLFGNRVEPDAIFRELRRLDLMAHVRNLTSICRAGLSEELFDELLRKYTEFRYQCGEAPTSHVALISKRLALQIARTLGVHDVSRAFLGATVVGGLAEPKVPDYILDHEEEVDWCRPRFPCVRS